jgi:hypothetical protein
MVRPRTAVFKAVRQWGRNLEQVLRKHANLTGVHVSWFGDHVGRRLLIPLAYQIPIDYLVQLSELRTLRDLCHTRGWGGVLKELYFDEFAGKTFQLYIIGPTEQLTFDEPYNGEKSWVRLHPSVIGATDATCLGSEGAKVNFLVT